MADREQHVQLVAPCGKWAADQVIAITCSNGDRLHVRVIKTAAGQPLVKEAYLLSRDRSTRCVLATGIIRIESSQFSNEFPILPRVTVRVQSAPPAANAGLL